MYSSHSLTKDDGRERNTVFMVSPSSLAAAVFQQSMVSPEVLNSFSFFLLFLHFSFFPRDPGREAEDANAEAHEAAAVGRGDEK